MSRMLFLFRSIGHWILNKVCSLSARDSGSASTHTARSTEQLTRNKHLIAIICISLGTLSRTTWNLGSCSALACTRPLASEECASTSCTFPRYHAQSTPIILRPLVSLHSFKNPSTASNLKLLPLWTVRSQCGVSENPMLSLETVLPPDDHLCGQTMNSASNRLFHSSDVCHTDKFHKILVQRNCFYA